MTVQYVQDNTLDGVPATANNIDISDIAELDNHDEEEESDCESLVGQTTVSKYQIAHYDHDDSTIISYLRQAFVNSPLVSLRRCENMKVVPANETEYTAPPTTTFQAHDDEGNK